MNIYIRNYININVSLFFIDTQVTKLKTAIKYGEEDLVTAKVLMENSPEDDPDTEVNHGCLLYKVIV